MKRNQILLLCIALFMAGAGMLNAAPMEKVAYLGVVTKPVGDVIRHQLGLTKGTGLVVEYVAPESPAEGRLEEHDILLKFEDQILVSQHQLAILVRGKQHDDQVSLTVFRRGKEELVKVALKEKEMPVMESIDWGNFDLKIDPFGESHMQGSFDAQVIRDAIQQAMEQAELKGEDLRNQLQNLNKRINGHMQKQGKAEIELQPGVSSSISTTVMVDGDRTITITDRDGARHLTVKNADGSLAFDGPVNNDKERAEVPEDVRPILENFKLKRMNLKREAL